MVFQKSGAVRVRVFSARFRSEIKRGVDEHAGIEVSEKLVSPAGIELAH